MDRLFRDPKDSGYFFTGADGEALLARSKDSYDGATPSGNSVAALVLLRLARVTGDPALEQAAQSLFRAFSGVVSRIPSAHTQLLGALDFALGPSREIVIAGEADDPVVTAMLRVLAERFLPRKVVLWNRPDQARLLESIAPFVKGQRAKDGAAAAFLCENYACRAPVTTADALARLLDAPIPEAAS
jgi:hypothetical protein